jgi:predicted ATPase
MGEDWGYSIIFGMPEPVPGTQFFQDPEIKREVIWHGETWREAKCLVDRRGPMVRARDGKGQFRVIEKHLPAFDSIMMRVADPECAPETMILREQLRGWRFYDHFRCDKDSPARQSQVGVRTPVLSHDGHDLASALQTIIEIGDEKALISAVQDGFPGAEIGIINNAGRFEVEFKQPGLLRPLSQAELSDGTLRYLLLVAALLTPRPPPLMVLNEPETSLHPDLIPALGRLMHRYAWGNQLWVVSHSELLVDSIKQDGSTNHILLEKELGQTLIHGQDMLNAPAWKWPSR